MEMEKTKAAIEAILFACGREVQIKELMSALELGSKEIIDIIDSMKLDYEKEGRGIEIIRMDDAFQLTTKKDFYEYIYPIFDNRAKPNLSTAALETLSIIAYNPKITRAEIETIRGVSSDGTIYKLMEYNLIANAGKSDAPGKPTMYVTTNEFLKMFGITSLDELPELPKYKLDENRQIVIDDIVKNEEEIKDEENIENIENSENIEAPMPEREEQNEELEQENKEKLEEDNNEIK
ncbi:MAG: SMC-Scp complex subunit ScpB [Clostridia bacterium]|nr:SMC-Scp complex subunit ScpB [Clostridia bacterium]